VVRSKRNIMVNMRKTSINPNYSVTPDGDVISNMRKLPIILYPNKDRLGYLGITMTNQSGKRKRYGIHRLVAQAYIPNPENKPQINHINGIKTDNRVSNLEWCTQRENNIHALRTGLRNNRRLST
jgi:hypothetical protein